MHVVRTEFVVSGDVSDYDDAKKASIKAIIAEAASVTPFVVRLQVEPASVRILAEITFDDAATATATAAALGGTPSAAAPNVRPIFADLPSLNAAFASTGLSVISISTPPKAQIVAAPVPPSPAFPSLSPRVGAVTDAKQGDPISAGALAGGLVFFQLVMFAACYYYRTRTRAGKQVTITSVHMAASHANVPRDMPQASAAAGSTLFMCGTTADLAPGEYQDAADEMDLINEIAVARAGTDVPSAATPPIPSPTVGAGAAAAYRF